MTGGFHRLFATAAFCLWLMSTTSAFAQAESDQPVLLTAETLKYDQSLGLVTAEGDVELVQGGRTLIADLVSYSERDDKVIASGNVALMETDGTVLDRKSTRLNSSHVKI